MVRKIISTPLPFDINSSRNEAVIKEGEKKNVLVVSQLVKEFIDQIESNGYLTHIDFNTKRSLEHIIQNSYDAIHLTDHPLKPLIVIMATMKNGQIILRIRDNGCGFTKVKVPISKRKSTFKDEHVPFGGHGVGLKDIKENLTEVGGQIHISNNKEAGATVCIKVPAR